MISFFIGSAVGMTVALFIVGANKNSNKYDAYMEGYCDGIKSARGEENEEIYKGNN